MRIAILTAVINRKSGARAPLEISKSLKKLGNEVTIFGYKVRLEKEALSELKKGGVRVSLVKKGLPGSFNLYLKLKKGNFDIISFHGTLPFFLAACASGIPIARTYYGTQLDPLLDKVFPKKPNAILKIANQAVNLIIKKKEKIFLSGSAQTLAISQYTQQELKDLYQISSEAIYLGAAPASFKKKAKKDKTKREILILSVSRIVPYKGFHRLIRIFNKLSKKYPEIRLKIIGSSPDKRYLAYLNKKASKNIEIKTNVSDRQLIKAYRQADIYTSFDRYLFFGMPILEAATFAIPSVAMARCAALETIIHGKTGYLAKNEAEFESFLEKLVKDKNLREKLGSQACQNTKRFSWENLAKKYHQIFEKVKRQKRPKTGRLLAGIVLLGAALRLAFIGRHAFWFDEAWSFFVARQPFSVFFKVSASETTPPLYSLILKGWLAISQEVFFLRALSLVFGVLTIPIAYFLFSKLTNSKTALLATTFLTLSPLHIYFSVETRMYSLLVFEILIIALLFLKFVKEKKNLSLLLLTFAGLLALYTHYYSALFLLALNLLFFANLNKYQPLVKPWLASQLVIGLFFAPWFLGSLQNLGTGCWCFHPVIGLPATFVSFAANGMGVVTLKEMVFYGPRLSLVLFSFSSLLALLAFFKGTFVSNKKDRRLLVFFFAPLILASVAGLFTPLFSPRALIIISPFYYLLVSLGISSIKKNLLRNLFAKILIVLFLATLVIQFFDPFFYGPPLKKAANNVFSHFQEKEAILHTSPMTFYSFLYFHQDSYPEFLVLPDKKLPPIFEIGGYQKKIEEIIQEYEKIWLVNTRYWVPLEEVEKTKKAFEPDFVLDQEVNYNNIQLYHYAAK